MIAVAAVALPGSHSSNSTGTGGNYAKMKTTDVAKQEDDTLR